MVISDDSKSDHEICVLAKQVNARNKQLDVRATCSFELVHTDLVGPIDPVTKDIFSFTYDFCGCLFTYFLKDKSDAVNATKRFSAHIAPYGKIKSLNFDNNVIPSGKAKLVIYQKVLGTFLFKILLNMNLLHHIRLVEMVKKNEIGALCLICPDLCY